MPGKLKRSARKRSATGFSCARKWEGRPSAVNLPFRFILNHSEATAANVYLMLYPKPVLSSALSRDGKLYRALWKALSSITAETLVEGRVYGGLHKLEPKELANVSGNFVLDTLRRAHETKLYRQDELIRSVKSNGSLLTVSESLYNPIGNWINSVPLILWFVQSTGLITSDV